MVLVEVGCRPWLVLGEEEEYRCSLVLVGVGCRPWLVQVGVGYRCSLVPVVVVEVVGVCRCSLVPAVVEECKR